MQNPLKRVILDSNIWISFAIGKRLNELRIALTHPKIKVFVCQKYCGTANADFLVTGDNDLLILKKYHNTNIVSFSSFMAAIDTL